MRFRGRRFLLNPPGVQSTAAVVAEIEDTRTWQTGRFRKGTPLHWDDEAAWSLTPDVTFRFTDCDRGVSFAIEWESARLRRSSLAKVDRMIESLTEFRAALADEQRLYVKRVRAARLAGPPPKTEKEKI